MLESEHKEADEGRRREFSPLRSIVVKKSPEQPKKSNSNEWKQE
jgi:hypothetical protein